MLVLMKNYTVINLVNASLTLTHTMFRMLFFLNDFSLNDKIKCTENYCSVLYCVTLYTFIYLCLYDCIGMQFNMQNNLPAQKSSAFKGTFSSFIESWTNCDFHSETNTSVQIYAAKREKNSDTSTKRKCNFLDAFICYVLDRLFFKYVYIIMTIIKQMSDDSSQWAPKRNRMPQLLVTPLKPQVSV